MCSGSRILIRLFIRLLRRNLQQGKLIMSILTDLEDQIEANNATMLAKATAETDAITAVAGVLQDLKQQLAQTTAQLQQAIAEGGDTDRLKAIVAAQIKINETLDADAAAIAALKNTDADPTVPVAPIVTPVDPNAPVTPADPTTPVDPTDPNSPVILTPADPLPPADPDAPIVVPTPSDPDAPPPSDTTETTSN